MFSKSFQQSQKGRYSANIFLSPYGGNSNKIPSHSSTESREKIHTSSSSSPASAQITDSGMNVISQVSSCSISGNMSLSFEESDRNEKHLFSFAAAFASPIEKCSSSLQCRSSKHLAYCSPRTTHSRGSVSSIDLTSEGEVRTTRASKAISIKETSRAAVPKIEISPVFVDRTLPCHSSFQFKLHESSISSRSSLSPQFRMSPSFEDHQHYFKMKRSPKIKRSLIPSPKYTSSNLSPTWQTITKSSS